MWVIYVGVDGVYRIKKKKVIGPPCSTFMAIRVKKKKTTVERWHAIFNPFLARDQRVNKKALGNDKK